MNHMHSFQFDKGTQELNFFAIKEGGKINYMKAIKLCWSADRYHLRKYGRSVSDDSYKAMKMGPVPSTLKDIAVCSEFLSEDQVDYLSRYIKKGSGHEFSSLKSLDDSVFSETDLEALDFAYETLGGLDEFQLVEVSHAFPEWKRFEQTIKEGRKVVDMTYEDFFKDAQKNAPELKVLDYKDPFVLPEEELNTSKENYLSKKQVDRLWD